MKKFFKFAAIAAAAFALLSCGKDPQGGEGTGTGTGNENTGLNQDLKFELELLEVEATSAKIKVQHDGETTDTWYWFVTTDSDIEGAVLEKVDELTESGNVSLNKSKGKNVTAKDLDPETEYTFVVFGLSTEGEVYGNTGTLEFKTKKGEITGLEESEEWKIAYAGREDGKEMFSIECGENSLYFFDIVSEYAITDDNGKNYLQEYLLMMVEQLQAYLDYGISMEELYNYGLIQMGPGTLQTDRMPSDTYYAFAIGYEASGEPTGTYSAIKFTIEPEVAEEAYLQWIGTYDLTDKNGATYRITLHDVDPNYMYAVTGWECGEWLNETGMDFTDALGTELYFFAYYNQGKVEFREEFIADLTVTDNTGAAHETEFGLYGYATFPEGTSLITTGGSTLAVAESGAEGITVNGVDMEFDGGEMATVSGMGYAAMVVGGNNFFRWNAPMELPFTMSPVAAGASQQSMAVHMDFNKNIKNSFKADNSYTLFSPKPAFQKAR